MDLSKQMEDVAICYGDTPNGVHQFDQLPVTDLSLHYQCAWCSMYVVFPLTYGFTDKPQKSIRQLARELEIK